MKEHDGVLKQICISSVKNGYVVTTDGSRYVYSTFTEAITQMCLSLGLINVGDAIKIEHEVCNAKV